MKNNSEKSIVNAAQSTGYPTLEMFWKSQQSQMENIKDFKDRLLLPPTRIKKIMKKNEDDLTLRSSLHAQENHRRILKKDDLTDVIVQTDYFDFLLDVVHRNGATDPFTPNSVPLYAAGGSNEEDGCDIQNPIRGN
ncbi:nuclear transcription factor Y subunit C-1-like [Solanum lycopersicum]|uniref:nuclear transcription factor Y subunit C-1-like n=1 Tax=Solanum lycopersicum TaxID=4081 RepID=UPI003747BD23